MRTLSSLVICCGLCLPLLRAEDITVQNANTDNPTLLYKQKPMLKTGPISEDRVFMYAIGSDFFDHKAWFDYMAESGFGFARVYPAHTWHEDQRRRSTRPLHPFETIRYAKDGDPVVDLLTADKDYWANFSRVLDEAQKRDIVVCIQLYQRWYWGNRDARNRLFFGPDYNVNGIDEIDSRKVWKNMSDAYPDGKLWLVHQNFVNEVLNAIGDHKNVMIDLMNEGAIIEGMTKEWINHTLEIIKTWEAKNNRDILVGMDIDHFLMKKDTDNLHWLLSHPAIETIVGEDKWIYFSTDDMISMRSTYKKPMIWVNEKAVDYMDTYSLCDHPNRRLHYLWLGMMAKIQGLGIYEKENHTQQALLGKPQAAKLGKYNLILMRFFDNEIKDYALLRNSNDIIRKTPPVTRKVALCSAIETIVYLHKGFEQRQEAGAELELGNLSLPDGSVPVRFVHPNTGESSTQRAAVKNASLTLTLPEFYENLAVMIAGKQKTQYTLKRGAILERN
jgi:hypothetical protein